MKEQWKILKGYKGYYKISNLGRVKSVVVTKTISRGRPATKKEKILTNFINKNGYPIITIRFNKKSTTYLVHRLVADHFVENPNNYKIVNHIDGDKSNCKANNLEWTTSSLNQKHAYATGLKKRKLSPEDKKEIIILRSCGLTYYEIADKFNVSYQIVGRICKNHQQHNQSN